MPTGNRSRPRSPALCLTRFKLTRFKLTLTGVTPAAYIDRMSIQVAKETEQELKAKVHDRELEKVLLRLAANPHIGHRRGDLLPARFGVWPFYAYLIIYKPGTPPLEVVRIWHGTQRRPSLI